MAIDTNTVLSLMPEILLVSAAALVFVGGAFSPRAWMWTGVGLLACVVAGLLLVSEWNVEGMSSPTYFYDFAGSGPLLLTPTAFLLRGVALLCGALFVLASRQEDGGGERCGGLLLVTAGTMLVTMANDLVLLFLALELISIPTYMLLYLGRKNAETGEATAKYFYLSIFSSGVLLYGFTMLYGLSGSTNLTAVQAAIAAGESAVRIGSVEMLLPLALIFVVAGLGYKIAAVPFHYYAPDVYQGATCLNAGVLAVMPKIAGVMALLQIMGGVMPLLEPFVWQVMLLLSVLSMTLGNVCALWQGNVRRLLAYSSIAHAGYLLLALTAALALAPAGESGLGVAALLLYLTVYAIATLGIFAALAHLGSSDEEVSTIDQLAGIGRTRPLIAAALAVMLFSLAGIPPLAGFWGKFGIFYSALTPLGELANQRALSSDARWLLLLALAGVLNAAVAAAYYLRVIAAMYFRSPVHHVKAEGGLGASAAALICAAAVVVLGVAPRPLMDMAGRIEATQSAAVSANEAEEALTAEAANGEGLVSYRD